jgi:hypothetical protein
MDLSQKMFSRENATCPVRSDCKKESDRKYFDTLFDDDWEVLVIKRDNIRQTFDWFTLCCESAGTTNNGQ